MKQVLFTITILATLSLFAANPVGADVTKCQPVYGGGDSCVLAENLQVDAFIQNPKSKQFVDNLGINDASYSPNQQIPFRVTVKNTSNRNVNRIEVRTIFPQYVDFVSGPSKTYDPRTKTLTFTIDTLKANETRNFDLRGKVATADKLPKAQNTSCMAFQARAAFGNTMSADTAQFCVQKTPQPTQAVRSGQTTKGGLAVQPAPTSKTTPPTGPQTLTLLALIPTGLAGLLLRKYDRN
jgi:uncharacterized repeat protein (TIGR01451 family)